MSPDELIDAILDAVAELPPAQRRQLQRRLTVAGLFVPETLATDQGRLHAAPALGKRVTQARAAKAGQAPISTSNTSANTSTTNSARSSFVQPTATKPVNVEQSSGPETPAEKSTKRTDKSAFSSFFSALPPAEIAPAPVERVATDLSLHKSQPPRNRERQAGRAAPYHSPVSGKVVVGTPAQSAPDAVDPHLMPPLPGQAPERPLILVIERGSYMLRWPGEAPQRVRLTFRTHVTEQEAYYDTLIRLLETVAQRLHDAKADLQTARLDIRSADLLFVQQVLGEIPCEDITLRVRRTHALKQLDLFAEWRIVHQA